MSRVVFLLLGVVSLLLSSSELCAGIVTEAWTVTIAGGPFDGTVGSGTFSYDDALIITGEEAISPLDGLTIDLTILGQTFSEADDVGFDSVPELGFSGFVPVYMDYLIQEAVLGGSNPVDIDEPGVIEIDLDVSLTPASGGGFESTGSILVHPVPEPSTLVLASLGLLCIVFLRVRL